MKERGVEGRRGEEEWRKGRVMRSLSPVRDSRGYDEGSCALHKVTAYACIEGNLLFAPLCKAHSAALWARSRMAGSTRRSKSC